MKKIVSIVIIILMLQVFVIEPEEVLADSPLTSTLFSSAYEDIDFVKQANLSSILDLDMAKYLADENNPIDVKAAIINALSWEEQGRNNADSYCKYIYNDSLKNVDVSSLSGDQEFCIGYLIAMDDYINVTSSDALQYLTEAEQKIPDSFTVSAIRAIVESMGNFEYSWDYRMLPILENNNIQIDMRQDAVNIIVDYMSLYHKANEIILSDNSISIKTGESTKIYLFGEWMVSYNIVKDSDIADSEILQDEYGINYLMLTGTKAGSSSITIMNDRDESAVITFAVNSNGTEYAPSIPQTGEKPMDLLWEAGMAVIAVGMILCRKGYTKYRLTRFGNQKMK